LDTTAQIRKEIIAAKDMSTDGKNVKIITIERHVTLRGPVNSAEEKRVIGEIAERIAHSGNVANQLEVKFTASNN
jgi:osmotically-inducible protein OsmY